MLVTRKVFFGIWSAAFALIIGCQGEYTYSEPASPSEIEPTNDPVTEFRDYAKDVLVSAQVTTNARGFLVYDGSGRIKGTNRFKISDDYTIDVKKSDSLISPYVGLVKIKGRNVDHFTGRLMDGRQWSDGIGDLPYKWVEIEIKCDYKNGSWSVNTDLSKSLRKLKLNVVTIKELSSVLLNR